MMVNETRYSQGLYDAWYVEEVRKDTQLLMSITWYIICVVIPVIGITGLTANTIGLFVITKCGLQRISNILLFYLTLADILCLMGSVKYFLFLSVSSFGNEIVRYLDSFILAMVYLIIFVLSKTANEVSMHVTVWIMTERLLAIFFPLQFKILVTPTRIWVLGFLTFFASFTWNVYSQSKETSTETNIKINASVGRLELTYDNVDFFMAYDSNYICYYLIPSIAITLGSVVVSVKLAMTLERRRHLTTATRARRASARTVETLLMVGLKMFTLLLILLPGYIFQYISWPSEFTHVKFSFAVIVFTRTFIYINSTCNFIIHIAFNKKFRTIFHGLFPIPFR